MAGESGEIPVDESLQVRVVGEQIEYLAEQAGGMVLTDQDEIDNFYQACLDYWEKHPPTKP